MANTSEDRLWTVSEVAEYLHLPMSAVYKMTGPRSRLRIPHVKLSGRLRFRRADIDEWVELLAVSDLGVLNRIHAKSRRLVHGHHPQAEVGRR